MKATAEINLRVARASDAREIWRLVEEVGRLERNSCYAYVLLCSHFASTCVIAERECQLSGFVLAYRPPVTPQDVFVWQVGVAPAARGAGLGRRMLEALLALPACRDARFLTATVSDDNAPSLALFRSFARVHGVSCEESPGFAAALFAEPHADENFQRIGPLKGRT